MIPGALNRLQHEKSPYLLQHAANPVDWHPWGEEAFRAGGDGEHARTAREVLEPEIVWLAPFTQTMQAIDGRAAAYVCRNFSCRRPVTDPKELAAILGGQS
jgi:uncharacterized protein YyaL (SSP411 family)